MSDMPQWRADVRTTGLNLATWLNDPELDSDLNMNILVRGSGMDASAFELYTELVISGSRYGDQPFSRIRFAGDVNPKQVKGEFLARLDESELLADLELNGWQDDDPAYLFELTMKQFNAAELTGLENFPTRLNGTLTGEGAGFDPERVRLTATAEFDSSFVNREEIQTLRADFRIQDATLYMEDALLESPIADASISVRQHIIEFDHVQNTLRFDAEIKDLQPLAVLFGFETLQAGGTITGRMEHGERNVLQFDAGLKLFDVQVDTLFRSEKASGRLTAWLFDEPEADLEFDLTEPVVNEFGVQDVTLFTRAVIAEDSTSGRLGFRIVNGDESFLNHEGDFRVMENDIFLRTDVFDFATGLRTLSLQQPFNITFRDEVLRMDTLSIRSPGGSAYMSLWIPHADTLKQQAGIDAGNLDLGALQATFADEVFFEGIFSGKAEILNEPGNLEVDARGLLSDVRYETEGWTRSGLISAWQMNG
jgi:hypothetical protein